MTRATDKINAALEQLKKKPAGVATYSVKNNGHHIRIIGENGRAVDWWPSTSKWIFIDEESRKNPENAYMQGTPAVLFAMLSDNTEKEPELDFGELHAALGNLILAISNVMVAIDKVKRRNTNDSKLDTEAGSYVGSTDWEEHFNTNGYCP